MAPHQIRTYGDPVLKRVAAPVEEIDGRLVRLADSMLDAMYAAPGLGLAAPQVGVGKRFFVYDLQDERGPGVLVNPEIVESDGEWWYEEGCLSVPGLSWDIARPKEIHLVGYDLDGNEVSLEVDELEARLFQHELDHLDGRLLLDLLSDDEVKEAKRALRAQALGTPDPAPGGFGPA